MTLRLDPPYARWVSFGVGLCLVAPGFVVGLAGLTDMAPSSPRGIAGFAELFGFGFWAWAVFRAITALLDRFLADMARQIGNFIGAGVIAYGFYLFILVIGYAKLEYKQAFTSVLQPLGWIAALLLIAALVRRVRGTQSGPPPARTR